MHILRSFLKPLFWIALTGAYVLAILPPDDTVGFASDKANHMLAFFTLALLAGLAYPRMSLWRILLALAAFGAFIEITQMIPALHRDAEAADWYADVAATIVGIVIAIPARRFLDAMIARDDGI